MNLYADAIAAELATWASELDGLDNAQRRVHRHHDIRTQFGDGVFYAWQLHVTKWDEYGGAVTSAEAAALLPVPIDSEALVRVLADLDHVMSEHPAAPRPTPKPSPTSWYFPRIAQ